MLKMCIGCHVKLPQLNIISLFHQTKKSKFKHNKNRTSVPYFYFVHIKSACMLYAPYTSCMQVARHLQTLNLAHLHRGTLCKLDLP